MFWLEVPMKLRLIPTPVGNTYPMADRYDDVKTIMGNLVGFTPGRSMCKFCSYLILVKFTLFKNFIDMLCNHRPFPAKQLLDLSVPGSAILFLPAI